MSLYRFTRNVEFVKLVPEKSTLRDDLKKLADYLYSLPKNYEHFDMYSLRATASEEGDWDYLYGLSDIETKKLSCGTVACAVGHAPLAGIDCSQFDNYADLVYYLTNGNDSLLYRWLFSEHWREVDNTSIGAALRIYIALEHGIPVDGAKQSSGEVSVCYELNNPQLGKRYVIAKDQEDLQLIKFNPAPEVETELLKLADYLYNLPANYSHFEMSTFYYGDGPEGLSSPIVLASPRSCNTVACAVGHAPAAGIDCTRFANYQELVNWLTANNQEVFDWLFGGDWALVDNTHRGAAARIYFALEQGVPVESEKCAQNEFELPYRVLYHSS